VGGGITGPGGGDGGGGGGKTGSVASSLSRHAPSGTHWPRSPPLALHTARGLPSYPLAHVYSHVSPDTNELPAAHTCSANSKVGRLATSQRTSTVTSRQTAGASSAPTLLSPPSTAQSDSPSHTQVSETHWPDGQRK
jgi:hypothetical protein